MSWLSNIPQFGVIFLLVVRAAGVIRADLQDRRTVKRHGVPGILLTEAAYVGLFVGLLWWGGFWTFQ